jgi:uncharacterized membrane protein YeaQ/YmgE (transglycosylase-associated protein family)
MDPLLALIVTALLVGVLAFVAALLVRTRQGVLGYVGAGFLGMGLGAWLFALVKVSDPLTVSVAGASVPILATFVGALLILLLFRLAPRVRR